MSIIFNDIYSKDFNKLKLSISLRSNFDYNYLDTHKIRGEFYFWLASNKSQLADYAVSVDNSAVRFIIIKGW